MFLLSAAIFAIAVLATRQNAFKMAPASEAVPEMGAAIKRFVPYLVGSVAVVVVFGTALLVPFGEGLGPLELVTYAFTWLNEHTAPTFLPLLLLLIVLIERRRGPIQGGDPREEPKGAVDSVGAATWETTGHIGALVLLMALSVSVGGVVERAGLMEMVPHDLGSVWLTMGIMVVVLVVIGMTMDPYGAVILVSSTIAGLAVANGIDPVHFWMVVLVAFELGYLTPPVALNHLLTRQVVGTEAFEEATRTEGSFWMRNERILLPMTVMAITLVLVAFVPLLLGAGSDSEPSDAEGGHASISSFER